MLANVRICDKLTKTNIEGMMIASERRLQIIDLIKKDYSLTTAEISKRLNVSEMTIRRDLLKLEEYGLVIRTHGGAMLKENPVKNHLSFLEKAKINIEEKDSIAKFAASLIEPGDVIAISPGTTTAIITKYIKDITPLTVVTNAANLIMDLGNYPGIELILTGGILKTGAYALVGDIAEDRIRRLNINKYFLSVSAIHLEKGIMTHDIQEGAMTKLFINNSEEVIVVAEKAKLNKVALSSICGLDLISKIVTGKLDNINVVKQYKERVKLYEI